MSHILYRHILISWLKAIMLNGIDSNKINKIKRGGGFWENC
jgi:hypothetical protein